MVFNRFFIIAIRLLGKGTVMTANEILDMLRGILHTTGVFNFQWNIVMMWGIGALFMYLAIAKKYEPLLLLPIGFGIFIVNFPLVPLMGYSDGHGQLLRIFYHYGLEWEVIPCVIFLGLGAMTDFGPLIANPKDPAGRRRGPAGRLYHLYGHGPGGLHPERGGLGGHHRRCGRSDDHLSDPAPGATAARGQCPCGLFLHGHGPADPAPHHASDDQRQGKKDPHASVAAGFEAGKDPLSRW